MIDLSDTIAAIATPIGEGGIGVVRISGKQAQNVADEMFRTASSVPMAGLPTHTAHYGFAVEPATGERIDDGVLTIFRAPRSYTGEDSVEISCHAGLVAIRRVLEAVLKCGARLAEPGEFTKRAFINGRIDLAQAEAVLDIIRARTDEALMIARGQFEGLLSKQIKEIRNTLMGVMAYIEANIDFPEDVDEWDPGRLPNSIQEAISCVEGLLQTSDRGRIYRDGIKAVITGRTNVGKSSLLNALLRESRAIVTPIPGTTRDVIEESLSIRGIPIRTIDTAGMRDTQDPVEMVGVDRARRAVELADLVLVVLDAEEGLTAEDEALLRELEGKKIIIVLNKSDLVREADAAGSAMEISAWLSSNMPFDVPVINTAAPSSEGILELEEAMAMLVLAGGIGSVDGAIVSNVRHRHALDDTLFSLLKALDTARSGMSLDFVSIDLRSALDALGIITGETVAEDVIDRIFSEFCIGK